MHDVLKLIKAKPNQKILQKLHQFWKTQKIFENPKT